MFGEPHISANVARCAGLRRSQKPIALPLLLLKIVLMAVAAVVLITLLAAGGLLIALGVVVGVLIPLLPILLVVGLTFAIVRLMRRPATI